mgnify:CR=1 FL=1
MMAGPGDGGAGPGADEDEALRLARAIAESKAQASKRVATIFAKSDLPDFQERPEVNWGERWELEEALATVPAKDGGAAAAAASPTPAPLGAFTPHTRDLSNAGEGPASATPPRGRGGVEALRIAGGEAEVRARGHSIDAIPRIPSLPREHPLDIPFLGASRLRFSSANARRSPTHP